MADHNITVFIRGDASGLQGTLAGAASSLQGFSTAAQTAGAGVGNLGTSASAASSGMNMVGSGAAAAGGQIKTFASIAGMASAVIASFKAQGSVFSGIAAGAKTLASELATVMPIVLGVRLAMKLMQDGTQFVIDSFVKFDEKMVQSTAIMGDISSATKQHLVQAAQDVASQTTISADKAAEGLYFIASAGFKAEEAVLALPVAARFAQAGLMDMEQATEKLLDVTRAYRLVIYDAFGNMDAKATAANMEKVSDVITQAAIDSNATIEQVSAALTNKAAGQANVLGKSLQETTSVIEAFASVGIKGQVAGTQLSMVWRDLQKAALKHPEAFQAMKVSVYDANGAMRSTSDIMIDLNNSLKNMTDEGKKASLMQMGFTDKSMGAMLAVMDLGGEMKKYEAQLMSASGKTKDVAEKQLESLSAHFEMAKNAVQNFIINVGTGLLSVMSKIGDVTQEAFGNLAQIIQGVVENAKPMVTLFIQMAAAAIWVPFEKLVQFLTPVTEIMSKFKMLMADIFMYFTVKAALSSALFASSMEKIGASATSAAAATINSSPLIQAALNKLGVTVNLTASEVTAANREMATETQLAAEQIAASTGIMERSFGGVGVAAGGVAATGSSGLSTLSGRAAASQQAFGRLGGEIGNTGEKVSGLGSAAKGVFGSIASLAALAIIPVMNLMSSMSQAEGKAKELINQKTSKNDESTFAGMNASIAETYKIATDANKQVDEITHGNNEWFKGLAQLKGAFKGALGMDDDYINALKLVDESSQKNIDLLAKGTKARDNYNKMSTVSKMTQEQFAASVKGLGLELNMSSEDFEKNKAAIIKHFEGVQASMNNLPPAMKDVEGATVESLTSMSDAADKLEKSFKASLESLHDPIEAYKAAVKDMVDFSGVYDAAQSKNEESTKSLNEQRKKAAEAMNEGNKKAADATYEQQQKQIDGQIKVLENQKKMEAQTRADKSNDPGYTGAKGKTAKEQLQDDGRDTTNALDAKIEELRQQKGAISKGIAEVVTPADLKPAAVSLQNYMDSFKEQAEKISTFKNQLKSLKEDPALKGVISQSFLDDLSKLGPEKAGPIIEGILSNTEAFVANWKNVIHKATVDDPMDDWLNKINEKAAKAGDVQKNSIAIIQNAKGGVGLNMVQRIMSEMKDDAPELLDKLAQMLTGGPESVAKFDQIAQSFDATSQKAIDNSTKGLNIVQAVVDGNVDTLNNYMKELDPKKWEEQLKAMGLDDAMINTIKTSITTRVDTVTGEAKVKIQEILDMMKGIDTFGKRQSEAERISKGLQSNLALSEDERIKLQQNLANKLVLSDEGKNLRTFYPEQGPDGKWHVFYLEGRTGQKVYISADGNIFGADGTPTTFANGSENHVAQIAGAGSNRLWAEPETGGEAYIPLASNKRQRSVAILQDVAKQFGYTLSNYSAVAPNSPISYHAPTSPQHTVIPTSTKHETNFNGPIVGVNMEDAVMFAERKKRRANLTRG